MASLENISTLVHVASVTKNYDPGVIFKVENKGVLLRYSIQLIYSLKNYLNGSKVQFI